MEQNFPEKIFANYDYLKGTYIGCFCKDEMDELRSVIVNERSLHERIFALINTGNKRSSGEHWMGLVINHRTNNGRYFDSFGRYFRWLVDAVKGILNFTGQNTLYSPKAFQLAVYAHSIS